MEYIELDDIKKIKKTYGENMAHMCRELFPTILEKKGLLYHILETKFSKSKQLYEDIINEHKKYEFKNYIYYLYDKIMNNEGTKKSCKSVKELLKEKGYNLYECHNNKDIQKFKKYYAKKEELCTFNDPIRINRYHIFFLVKENIDEVKRKNFKNPKREDDYSTSILCLQFDKGERQRVSIKSRYNHTVSNPDATYSNNLENIVEGLTEAFENDYNFNIGNEYKTNFELENYVPARDNKFYKFSYEINNIYYCPNDNVIIDNGRIINIYKEKEKYIFLDYFILDLENKKIVLYDKRINDSFIDGLTNITNIEVKNINNYKEITIYQEEKKSIIKIDHNGMIISYENEYLHDVGDDFLLYNKVLKELIVPNLFKCGNRFLYSNNSLLELSSPNLCVCGDGFLPSNNCLKQINFPNLYSCGNFFLYNSSSLLELNLPKLYHCGDYFLSQNEKLKIINLPNLQNCGDYFCANSESIIEAYFPNLQYCGDSFLQYDISLKKADFSKLQNCKNNFLKSSKYIKEINLDELQECADNFMLEYFLHNICFSFILSLPNLLYCGYNNNYRLINIVNENRENQKVLIKNH